MHLIHGVKVGAKIYSKQRQRKRCVALEIGAATSAKLPLQAEYHQLKQPAQAQSSERKKIKLYIICQRLTADMQLLSIS